MVEMFQSLPSWYSPQSSTGAARKHTITPTPQSKASWAVFFSAIKWFQCCGLITSKLKLTIQSTSRWDEIGFFCVWTGAVVSQCYPAIGSLHFGQRSKKSPFGQYWPLTTACYVNIKSKYPWNYLFLYYQFSVVIMCDY